MIFWMGFKRSADKKETDTKKGKPQCHNPFEWVALIPTHPSGFTELSGSCVLRKRFPLNSKHLKVQGEAWPNSFHTRVWRNVFFVCLGGPMVWPIRSRVTQPDRFAKESAQGYGRTKTFRKARICKDMEGPKDCPTITPLPEEEQKHVYIYI